jgi:hypothetical protein
MSPIKFNGKTYNSFEEMPPEQQQLYDKAIGLMGDKNGNQIPDFMEEGHFQSMLKGDGNGVVFRGVTYRSFEEMPEDMRPKMKQAFDQLTQMGMINMLVYKLFLKK